MRRIKKFIKRITNRQNITAVGLLVATAGVIAILVGVVYAWAHYNNIKMSEKVRHNAYEEEIRNLAGITTDLEAVPDVTATWKTFENKDFNLSIKYPTEWSVAEEKTDPAGKYLDKVTFTNNKANNEHADFEVYIYSSNFSDPASTDNLIKKYPDLTFAECPSFDDITLGGENYPAKEINVSRK